MRTFRWACVFQFFTVQTTPCSHTSDLFDSLYYFLTPEDFQYAINAVTNSHMNTGTKKMMKV